MNVVLLYIAEFVKYVDVIGPEAVRSSPVTSMILTDINTFWKSTSDTARIVKTGTDVHFFQLQLVLMRSIRFQSTISY